MKQNNIAGIVLCIMGLLLCTFPKTIWKITEKWKSDNTTVPSKKYIIVIRILSGVFISIGIFLIIGIIK